MASTGLKGQPCGRSSSCRELFHSPEGGRYHHIVGSDRRRFTKCVRGGKWVEMMYMDFSLEISFNILRMSRNVSHLVGGVLF